jgi:hypothetical protein
LGSLSIIMAPKKNLRETAIIEFYREEIRQRYQLERLHEIPEFEAIPDTMLDSLREFFLGSLYPPPKERLQMDEAFDDMTQLLSSPTRLTPLIGAALGSMFRLSFHLPAIINTGLATIDAIKQTRQLETSLMAVAETMRPALDAVSGAKKSPQKYRAAMLRLISGVPEDIVRTLIDNVIRLFGALSDIKMLSGMLYLVERCVVVMESRSDVYTEKDRESIKLCLEVLRGGHNLFIQLKPKDFPNILKGIERVEVTWYEGIATQLNDPGTHEAHHEACG